MLKCLKQIVLSSKRRGCRMQNDGQNVWVTRCLKVGWLHERTSKVTQDPRCQDQDACRPWIMGVGWAGTTSGLLTWLCRTGENILLVYRGTSHGSGAGVKQNCCLWKFLFRKHLFFLAYSSHQQEGNCMDPSGFCAAQSNTGIIYCIFYSSSLTSRVRPIKQPIRHVVYTQERTRLYPIGGLLWDS